MTDHWQGLADFCRYDRLAGGPDSHMKTVVEMGRQSPDPAWLACVYVGVYNVPMALAIVDRFPRREHAAKLAPWLEEHWPHVVLRRERRRPVGVWYKLDLCLRSCAWWLEHGGALSTPRDYESTWQSADQVTYFGRYAKIKLLETLRQMGLVAATMPDLRARGGWSPREGLALLYPEQSDILEGRDTPETLRFVDSAAEGAQRRLLIEYGVDLSWYEFQTLVCDYKQVAVTRRQYPGRSLDSELDYHHKAAHFGVGNWMLEVRRHLFPQEFLGEVQGWPGVREDLGSFFCDTGEMWSDLVFEYPSKTRRP